MIGKHFLNKSNLIYMDYNSSTPVYKEVIESMEPFYNNWFYNPSSKYAKNIKSLLIDCKYQILELLKAPSDGCIVFYGGGTEAISSFLQGMAFPRLHSNSNKKHIISSAIEHDATIETLKHLQKLGFEVTLIPVNSNGVINPKDIENAITKNTLLVSVMHVNNETGVVQPIKEVSAITKKHNIPLHCDGIAAVGKLEIDIKDIGADAYTITAHKFYGPKGIALNYISSSIKEISPAIFGSKQEYGLRAGTENLTGAIGLTKALKITIDSQNQYINNEKALIQKFESLLSGKIYNFVINGEKAKRACNTTSISIKGLINSDIIKGLYEEGICTSGGAASIGDNYSHVIKAMGVNPIFGKGTVRFSIGKYTTEEHIVKAASALDKVVNSLRLQK